MADLNAQNHWKVITENDLFNSERARTGPVISCINCGEEGHRMRDCTQERKVFSGDLTCRICEYSPGRAN